MDMIKRCDHCRREINAKIKICPFCGGELDDTKVRLSPQCPRCRNPLETHACGDEKYDLCPNCGGLWLDRDEFHQATRESTVYKEEDLRKEYRRHPLEDTVAYIPCVRCGKQMNRKNFGRISGVILDECAKHGVWLDADELEKIRHFIADGGLERAQDKEIERNRIELEGLATKVDHIAFTQRLIHFWNLKRWLFGP